ncbi:hypothetical protein PLESTB_001621600 [Pleodorina starrii]|uniref:Uncharacterized protein n=1 Tax=Pleodorina starrii TaxID=330485 RepID=A0A9W6F996_9CHLO|nr:hypothetical protein PLESTM_001889400 [Pleodorina starrii]GLC60510.1 hypothetical protein PLESTB_001621600 [Pleodorina starrii]
MFSGASLPPFLFWEGGRVHSWRASSEPWIRSNGFPVCRRSRLGGSFLLPASVSATGAVLRQRLARDRCRGVAAPVAGSRCQLRASCAPELGPARRPLPGFGWLHLCPGASPSGASSRRAAGSTDWRLRLFPAQSGLLRRSSASGPRWAGGAALGCGERPLGSDLRAAPGTPSRSPRRAGHGLPAGAGGRQPGASGCLVGQNCGSAGRLDRRVPGLARPLRARPVVGGLYARRRTGDLVYMVTWWLPHHRGRDGGEVGPSAVKGCLSALSGFFARAGRTGPYNAHTGQGNPCDCVWVEDFRAAYQRTRVLAGVSEVSAVPMTYAKYRALVAYLWGAVAQAPCSLERIVLLRDLLCVLLLWQTAFRGHDIGKLGLGDFVDPAQPDRPYTGFPLPPPWLWGSEAAPTLGFRQRGTKTYKLARAPLVLLEPNSAEPALCIPRTLAHYVWCCSQPDAPAGSAVVDLLFRPLAADKRSFKDTALTSASLAARVRLHLEAAGLHDQETVHSFRRGALQAAEAAGGEVPTLLGLGQLRSLATLSRYLDRHRHERDVRPRS